MFTVALRFRVYRLAEDEVGGSEVMVPGSVVDDVGDARLPDILEAIKDCWQAITLV